MSRTVAIVLTIVAGVIVALQPPANAALGRHVGDFGAGFLSAAISMTIIGTLLVAFGHPGRLAGITGIRPEMLLGGVGGAAVVTVGLTAVRPLGAGAVVALLVASQVIVSVIVDRLGWFGLHQVGIGAGRVTGIALIVAGTVLVTRT